MAKQRIRLSDVLNALCPNVYFQPPGGHKLKYPCIVYSLKDLVPRYANNNVYSLESEYDLQYITRDPDDSVIRKIAMIPSCRMNSSFSADNVHHYQYSLYY